MNYEIASLGKAKLTTLEASLSGLNYFSFTKNEDLLILSEIKKELLNFESILPTKQQLKDVHSKLNNVIGLFSERELIHGQLLVFDRLIQINEQIQQPDIINRGQLQVLYLSVNLLPEIPIKKILIEKLNAIRDSHQLRFIEQVDLKVLVPFTFSSEKSGIELLGQIDKLLNEKYSLFSLQYKKVILKQAILNYTEYDTYEDLLAFFTEQIEIVLDALSQIKFEKEVSVIASLLEKLYIIGYNMQSPEMKLKLSSEIVNSKKDFNNIDQLNRFIIIAINRYKKSLYLAENESEKEPVEINRLILSETHEIGYVQTLNIPS